MTDSDFMSEADELFVGIPVMLRPEDDPALWKKILNLPVQINVIR